MERKSSRKSKTAPRRSERIASRERQTRQTGSRRSQRIAGQERRSLYSEPKSKTAPRGRGRIASQAHRSLDSEPSSPEPSSPEWSPPPTRKIHRSRAITTSPEPVETRSDASSQSSCIKVEVSPSLFQPVSATRPLRPAVPERAVSEPAVFNPVVPESSFFESAGFDPTGLQPASLVPAGFDPSVFNPEDFESAFFQPAVSEPAVLGPGETWFFDTSSQLNQMEVEESQSFSRPVVLASGEVRGAPFSLTRPSPWQESYPSQFVSSYPQMASTSSWMNAQDNQVISDPSQLTLPTFGVAHQAGITPSQLFVPNSEGAANESPKESEVDPSWLAEFNSPEPEQGRPTQ